MWIKPEQSPLTKLRDLDSSPSVLKGCLRGVRNDKSNQSILRQLLALGDVAHGRKVFKKCECSPHDS